MPQKFVSKRIPKTDYPRLGALGLSTILKELIRQHHNSRPANPKASVIIDAGLEEHQEELYPPLRPFSCRGGRRAGIPLDVAAFQWSTCLL